MILLTRKPQDRPALITRLAGFSVNIMVDPAGTGRGPRQTLAGYVPWIAATQVCLIIAMLVMAGGLMCWCRPAQGADQPPAARTPPLTLPSPLRKPSKSP
jgi:hypothetical protein